MLSGLDFNDDTQVAQAAQQALGELLFVSFDEVAAALVVVLDPIAEHEVRGSQHRGGDLPRCVREGRVHWKRVSVSPYARFRITSSITPYSLPCSAVMM
jgi:hypothetical protein